MEITELPDDRLSPSPQNIGFAREHRGPRQRGCLRITVQHPADQIGRQPGEMNQVADIVVGDVFTNRNFRHRLRFACRELFEPDRCACDRLYDNGVMRAGFLTLKNEFAGSATGRGRNRRLK
jgi:hypothetical protein